MVGIKIGVTALKDYSKLSSLGVIHGEKSMDKPPHSEIFYMKALTIHNQFLKPKILTQY